MNEGQYFGFLHQPAAHLVFEYGRFAGGAKSFAVHHAHAAQALLVGRADVAAHGLARFVGAQAMQIDLPLHSPVTAA